MRRRLLLSIATVLLASAVLTATEPEKVLIWPSFGAPILRFGFRKFEQQDSVEHAHNYTVQTSIRNLWDKPVRNAVFALTVLDINNVPSGNGEVTIGNLEPNQTMNLKIAITASHRPASVQLRPTSLPPELDALIGQY